VHGSLVGQPQSGCPTAALAFEFRYFEFRYLKFRYEAFFCRAAEGFRPVRRAALP